MAIQDGDKFIVNRGGTDYKVSASDIEGKLQDTDLLLIYRGGIDYKITGADLKEYLNPKLPLEVNIHAVERVGNDHSNFRGTVRFTTNVPDTRPYNIRFTPRKYPDGGGGPVTEPLHMYDKQNIISFNYISNNNSAVKEKYSIVLTEDGWKPSVPEWESPQFDRPGYSSNSIKRLKISPNSGLYVDGDTITFNEDQWFWGEDYLNTLTPLTEYELSNLHIRFYSALTGQKVAGGEFSGDIRDPAKRTLDISSGELKDAYGNLIKDVTCRVEYKTNVTYGTLIGETGWMLPIKPFSWTTDTRGGENS